MHSFSRERVWRSRLHRLDLELVGVEGLAGAQHAPGDAGELVGKCGSQLVAMHPRRGVCEPRGKQPVHPISGHRAIYQGWLAGRTGTFKTYARAKAGIEGSLKALDLGHIDLMLIHSERQRAIQVFDLLHGWGLADLGTDWIVTG